MRRCVLAISRCHRLPQRIRRDGGAKRDRRARLVLCRQVQGPENRKDSLSVGFRAWRTMCICSALSMALGRAHHSGGAYLLDFSCLQVWLVTRRMARTTQSRSTGQTTAGGRAPPRKAPGSRPTKPPECSTTSSMRCHPKTSRTLRRSVPRDSKASVPRPSHASWWWKPGCCGS